MDKKILAAAFFWVIVSTVSGQELFPHAEPASTMPKGVSGFRFFYERYNEQTSNRIKDSYHIRYMYGITSKWTAMATLGVSNHHYSKFPTDLLPYFFNHHLKSYPPASYGFEGLNVYSKYRFFTHDSHHRHLRLAVFAEGCKSFVAHDDAEPTLMTDNSGYGGGLISTYLLGKFATSVTLGFIHPLMYTQSDIDVRFQSGDATYMEISTGYRIWPLQYESYSDVNINLYAECMFKQYGAAYVEQHGQVIDFAQYAQFSPYTYNAMKASSYIAGMFAVQFISNSNTRIDVGVTLALKDRSYTYWSPMFTVQYQTYLYSGKKNKK